MPAPLPLDERHQPGDVLYSYALRPYANLTAAEGSLHNATILYESLDRAGVGAEAAAVVTATRKAFCSSRTAWGVKSEAAGPSWELYYYKHAQSSEPIVPVTPRRARDVAQAAGLHTAPSAVDDIGYFSVSFDLNLSVLRREADASVHVYVDQSPCDPPIAMSYEVRREGLQFENAYFLCRQQPPDLDFAHRFVFSSVHVDADRIDVDCVLWPELLECDHIALAHKPHSDGVYFGGVTVDQLEPFFDRTRFDPDIAKFIRQHRTEFAELRFDVGFDFVGDTRRGVEIRKSAIYGFL